MIKKLEQSEIEKITSLQREFNTSVFELGSVESQIQMFLAQIKLLEETKSNVLLNLNKIEESEKELVNSLQEKYGSGNLDIEKGEIDVL